MKTIVNILTILFAVSFLNGCNHTTEPETKYDGTKPVRTVIAGKVIDPPEDNTTLMFIVNDLATARQLISYSDIDLKDSTFHFTIERYLPQDIMIKYFELFSVFVHPGDSLFVTIDYKLIDSGISIDKALQFSGEPAEFNMLLQKYRAGIKRRDFDKFYAFQKRATPVEMKHFADSVRDENISYLMKFDSLYHPDEELTTYLKVSVESNYVQDLGFYPFMHARLNNLSRDDVVTSSYYDFFKEINLPENAIINPSINTIVNYYRAGYVSQHLIEKLRSENKVRDTIINNKQRHIFDVEYLPALLKFIPEITEDTLLLQLSLCELYGQRLEGMNYRFFEKNRDVFDKYVTKPYLREPLLAYYNEVKYKCLKPEIASQAVINDLKNTSAEKIYSRILENNKGKVIYLDCWETACSPCRAEMPYSKKLMAKLDTSRVTFVYICFHSKEDAWKALLDEWQLGGQHYFADRNQSKYLSKAFSISGFPHYMLIDTKGNIVETGLRPSFNETYFKIKGLIEKE